MPKQQLRREIRARKRQFTAKQLAELSLAPITRLMAHPRIQAAHTILLYCSLPDEVDTRQAINQLLAAGKTVLLPVVTSDGEMIVCPLTSPDDLQEGAFHILEPTGTAFTDYDSIEVAVVPGMSFDAEGHRLGRGKGYYDRFLPLIPRAYKIGICFDFQKTAHVPTDTHDVPMDEVL